MIKFKKIYTSLDEYTGEYTWVEYFYYNNILIRIRKNESWELETPWVEYIKLIKGKKFKGEASGYLPDGFTLFR